MATKDRWCFLCDRSLPSIRRQIAAPEMVILVNDGEPFQMDQIDRLQQVLAPIPVVILVNQGLPGAAGSWNTGLGYLRCSGFDGYVAMLDDDDEWDDVHLAVTMSKAKETGADVVVSGLRRVVHGEIRPRPLPEGLRAREFLCGNPGLQGSNTFVALGALERAGDFTDGLPSLNDRDLGFRLLNLPGIRVAYTGQWTTVWHHRPDGETLSAPRSAAKIRGLQWFWRLYGAEMTEDEASSYFHRALHLFGVTRGEVLRNG